MKSDIKSGATVTGKVTVRIWDVGDVENADPYWSDRTREERHDMLCSPSTYPAAPFREFETSNIPVDGYLEALAAGDNPQPTHLAFGDGTTAPDASNTTLNNEVYRTVVGEDEADGRDRITSTLLSQNEANGHSITEIGFVSGAENEQWDLLTHTVLDSADQIDEKTSNMMVTFNYVLSWQRVD